MYNILVVDDSALMRKFMCDIINGIDGYRVGAMSGDGESAYLQIKAGGFDAVTLNMSMPTYDGIEILTRLKKDGIFVPVIAISSSIKEDRELASRAMDLGAVDLILRPLKVSGVGLEEFSQSLVEILVGVCERGKSSSKRKKLVAPKLDLGLKPQGEFKPKYDIVAIASSTGGPGALQTLMGMFPKRLGVPVVVVQHMPGGFTASLAERLDNHCKLTVKEARKGELLSPDTVYIAKGGKQLEISVNMKGFVCLNVTDDPPVNNLKPCADVMFRSLANSPYKRILCVVLTGMGSDGTEGIADLKKHKRIRVLTQSESSCVVYGMPKAAYESGLSDAVVDLKEMANAIAKELGVL